MRRDGRRWNRPPAGAGRSNSRPGAGRGYPRRGRGRRFATCSRRFPPQLRPSPLVGEQDAGGVAVELALATILADDRDTAPARSRPWAGRYRRRSRSRLCTTLVTHSKAERQAPPAVTCGAMVFSQMAGSQVMGS